MSESIYKSENFEFISLLQKNEICRLQLRRFNETVCEDINKLFTEPENESHREHMLKEYLSSPNLNTSYAIALIRDSHTSEEIKKKILTSNPPEIVKKQFVFIEHMSDKLANDIWNVLGKDFIKESALLSSPLKVERPNLLLANRVAEESLWALQLGHEPDFEDGMYIQFCTDKAILQRFMSGQGMIYPIIQKALFNNETLKNTEELYDFYKSLGDPAVAYGCRNVTQGKIAEHLLMTFFVAAEAEQKTRIRFDENMKQKMRYFLSKAFMDESNEVIAEKMVNYILQGKAFPINLNGSNIPEMILSGTNCFLTMTPHNKAIERLLSNDTDGLIISYVAQNKKLQSETIVAARNQWLSKQANKLLSPYLVSEAISANGCPIDIAKQFLKTAETYAYNDYTKAELLNITERLLLLHRSDADFINEAAKSNLPRLRAVANVIRRLQENECEEFLENILKASSHYAHRAKSFIPKKQLEIALAIIKEEYDKTLVNPISVEYASKILQKMNSHINKRLEMWDEHTKSELKDIIGKIEDQENAVDFIIAFEEKKEDFNRIREQQPDLDIIRIKEIWETDFDERRYPHDYEYGKI